MSVDKELVIAEIHELLGFLPEGTRQILKTLTHPAMIDTTKAYFSGIDVSTMCKNYEAPWDCIQEANAKYETIHFGYTEIESESWYDGWCHTCKFKER